MRAQTVFFCDLLQQLDQPRLIQVDAGYVNGYRQADPQPRLPIPDLRGGFRPDKAVQTVDQTVVFEQRNEYAGADHPKRWMAPAHESLSAAQNRCIRTHVKLGLIMDLKLFFPDRTRKILNQLRFKKLCLMQGIIINANGTRKVVFYCVCGDLGPVKAALDVQRFICIRINAHPDPDAVFALPGFRIVHGNGHTLQQRIVVRVVRAVDQKRIRIAAAGNAACLLHESQRPFSDTPENVIAVTLAIAIIDRVEMIDVHQDSIRWPLGMMRIKLDSIAIEKVSVIKACQLIPLCPAKDIPVFRKLNGAQHTGKNNLLPWVRFRDKVDGAQRKAFHLRVTVRRHDDNGDTGKADIGFHLTQHVQSVDIRQIQIQKDQAQCLILCVYDLQRLSTRLRRDDLIVFPEIHLQDLLIDEFILYQQNPSHFKGGAKDFLFFRHVSFTSCPALYKQGSA